MFICFNISVCRGGLDRMCLLKMSYEKRLMTYLESVSTGGPDQGYYSFAFFTSFYFYFVLTFCFQFQFSFN